MNKVWALIILCLAISFYLEQFWIIFLLLVASILIIIGGRPNKKKTESKKQETEEILHPVIYEDVGEPPYLYPPKFDVKVYPKAWKKTGIEKVGYELGRVIGAFLGLFNKKEEKKDKKKDKK